jgi:long-chain acyl-CoA synthetase
VEGLSQQLASTKRIFGYEIWQDALPRTTTRKLKRFEIEKRVRSSLEKGVSQDSHSSTRDSLTADELGWLEDPQVRRALKVVQQASNTELESIGPRDNLELDLGLDSMQRVELVAALEKELGATVDQSRMSEIYTVRELVDAVRGSSHGTADPSRAERVGWPSILDEENTTPELLDLVKPGPVRAALLFLAFQLIQLFSRDRFDLRVTGLEKLPSRGPFILSPNHQSYIDPFIVGSLLPWPIFRDIFSVGTSDVFGSGMMRRIARWLRVVVVDPDANLIPAMRAGAFGLRRGRILFLFPEGERSIDGKPKTFKKGAAILSLNLQIPIVPVAIDGFYEVWPRGRKFFQKLNPLRVAIGNPIYPARIAHPGESHYVQLTAEVRSEVVRMWEDLQRGSHEGTRAAAMVTK